MLEDPSPSLPEVSGGSPEAPWLLGIGAVDEDGLYALQDLLPGQHAYDWTLRQQERDWRTH
eukprot:6813293-Alexandrium_andersonii.AAC.1